MFRASGFLACKKLRSCHSTQKNKQKANQTRKSKILFRSIRKVRSQDKLLPPKLERQTGEYRESQLTRVET